MRPHDEDLLTQLHGDHPRKQPEKSTPSNQCCPLHILDQYFLTPFQYQTISVNNSNSVNLRKVYGQKY